jgi:ATP-dependent DNA helicase RecQ
MDTPHKILKQFWGYTEFKPPQETIVNAVLKRENALVLLPTSGGKSLCYQLPALILEGVCIVISPLIALIEDQVNSLKEKNIKAIALTSQLTENEIITAFDNLQFGGFKFVYLSPEKLQSKFIQEKIKQLKVSLIAIDEAHCISEWGHDFRPSYLNLKILKELQPAATFIALTATATQIVLNDIQKNLTLENATIFKKSFQRKNLAYHVIKTEDIYGKLVQLLSRINESVIVYTNNRKQTKEVSKYLNRNFFKSSYYHGGLSTAEKKDSYNSWISNDTQIMVATNAFGMGIDKSNVRAVIHINIPASIENFIQEAGRAGRDGKEAHSILLTNKANVYDAEYRFKSNLATTKIIKKVYHHLNQYCNIVLGEIPEESFSFSFQEFCALYQLNILQTYNSIKTLERENVLMLDENYSRKSTLKFKVSNQVLFDYLEKNPSKNNFIQLILRSYGGVFEHFTIINEFALSKKLGIKKEHIIQELKELEAQNIVHYAYADTTSKLQFLVIREDDYTINRISKNIEQQNNLKFEKLSAVINYIENNKTCRNAQLLAYFNEVSTKSCGKCDVCLKEQRKEPNLEHICNTILALLYEEPLNSKEICTSINFHEKSIFNSLKILLEKNKITITSQNKFKLTSK